jgi:hypothetical protein
MNWNKRGMYVFVKTAPGYAENVWKRFQEWDWTVGTWVTTGDWDVVAWLDTPAWDAMYSKVTDIRSWEGVEWTSSHFVWAGWKNDWWWWEKPAGTWMMIRDRNLDGNFSDLWQWNWVGSACSMPGDWDYFVWVGGDTWDEVWDHVWDVNAKGWETRTTVPVRTWWNKEAEVGTWA